MQRFEHVSVRLSNDSHAITDISVFHAEQLGELERVGYELCAVTPLSDGTLLMFWKRPHTADAPPTPDFALGFQPPEAEHVDDDPLALLTENVLRELIEDLMVERHGADWIHNLGVTPERVAEWERRRDVERKKRAGVVVEERLLWYSDWTDLETVFKKNWQTFDTCFPSRRRFEVYIERLSALRNPDSHSRTLMPYERAQIDGMTGEIRQQVTVFRSAGGGGPEPEHFPRIELVTDSFGNISKTGTRMSPLDTGLTLRPGDQVTFNGSASDPDGDPVTWDIATSTRKKFAQRQEDNDFAVTWDVDHGDIGERVFVYVKLRGTKPYHRMIHGLDDQVIFMYQVLPPRR